MNKLLLTLLLANSLLLAACQTRYVKGLSAEQKHQAVGMVILDTDKAGNGYFLLQSGLSGESCRVTVDDDTVISKQDALLELKYAATKIGADTLANVHCEKGTRGSTGSSCLAVFTCTGDGYARKTGN